MASKNKGRTEATDRICSLEVRTDTFSGGRWGTFLLLKEGPKYCRESIFRTEEEEDQSCNRK